VSDAAGLAQVFFSRSCVAPVVENMLRQHQMPCTHYTPPAEDRKQISGQQSAAFSRLCRFWLAEAAALVYINVFFRAGAV
jgi:hypothetical protein